jgi:hypothetical protein
LPKNQGSVNQLTHQISQATTRVGPNAGMLGGGNNTQSLKHQLFNVNSEVQINDQPDNYENQQMQGRHYDVQNS